MSAPTFRCALTVTSLLTQPTSITTETIIHDNDLWAFLSVVAGEDLRAEFRPVLNSSLGVIYEVDGVEVPALRMQRLAEKGLLELNGMTSFGACPKCNSLNLTANFKCASCKAQSLSKVDLIVHYGCGHLAPVNEVFREGLNDYRCPSCHKEMKRVGIDYGRPGFGFICVSCHAVSQYPLLIMTCDKGHESKVSEEELILHPIYKLGHSLQTMPRIINVLSEVKRAMEEREIKCFALAQTKSRDGGALYISPILVVSVPSITVDFILEDVGWEFQVLQTIRKCADLGYKGLLVVKQGASEPIRDMVNPAKISVIAFDEESEIAGLTIQKLVELYSQAGRTPLP